MNRSKTNRFQVYGQQCLWLTLYIFQDTIYIKTWFYHPPLGSTPVLLGHEGSSETSILEGETLRLQCKGSYPLSWTYYQGISLRKEYMQYFQIWSKFLRHIPTFFHVTSQINTSKFNLSTADKICDRTVFVKIFQITSKFFPRFFMMIFSLMKDEMTWSYRPGCVCMYVAMVCVRPLSFYK